MEEHLHGRYTTLTRLKAVRDDWNKPDFIRLRADRAMQKIQAQLKDGTLNRLREQLIKATRAGDQEAVWKVECLIREHEGAEREDSK